MSNRAARSKTKALKETLMCLVPGDVISMSIASVGRTTPTLILGSGGVNGPMSVTMRHCRLRGLTIDCSKLKSIDRISWARARIAP